MSTQPQSANPPRFPAKTPDLKPLTPEEARVLLKKGTEAAFTGEYWDHKAEGMYACRHCGALLYRSEDKFDSKCGWPSFDDELPHAVRRAPDADGRRTEILCAHCNGHLGHVFLGEKMTPKDTRHCVNSLSMEFISKEDVKLGRAIFAGGCFWGVEHLLQQSPGVLATTVGYIGGGVEQPTYEQVCSKTTGHAEAVEVIFDPARTDFEILTKLFLEIHDPTQVDRQGPDVGEQYRSAIFFVDDEQKDIAQKLLEVLRKKGMKIATEIVPAGKFWPAEAYHQDYYLKKKTQPYCHAWTKRFD